MNFAGYFMKHMHSWHSVNNIKKFYHANTPVNTANITSLQWLIILTFLHLQLNSSAVWLAALSVKQSAHVEQK